MALDRRITITYEAAGGGRDQHGEYQPAPIVTKGVWATTRDLSSQDIIEGGGSRTDVQRDWKIRWDKGIAEVREEGRLTSLNVVDNGKSFDVLNVIEESGRDGDFRQRWLRLQGIFTT